MEKISKETARLLDEYTSAKDAEGMIDKCSLSLQEEGRRYARVVQTLEALLKHLLKLESEVRRLKKCR